MLSTVRLASFLASQSAESLAHILQLRNVTGKIDSFTDLALELLLPERIEQVLRSLTAQQLQLLPEVGQNGELTPEEEELVLLGLATSEGVFPEVLNMLNHLRETEGEHTEHLPPSTSPRQGSDKPLSGEWVHRAFTVSQQAALSVRNTVGAPLSLTKTGRVSQMSLRRLAEQQHAPIHVLQPILELLRTIGAIERRGQELWVSAVGFAWSTLPHPQRWLIIAAGMLGAVPSELRAQLAPHGDLAWLVRSHLPAVFPYAPPAEREQLTQLIQQADRFGVSYEGVLTPVAHALITQTPDVALRMAEEAFPQPAAGVYIQPDLTIIAPGPLNPAIGFQLLAFTDLDAPGLAASMSVSERSITRALDAGWSIEEIRSTLTDVSLTPLPQPLEYLLDDLERKHGSITVTRETPPGRGSVIHVSDEPLARELLADSNLRHLGLTAVTGVAGVLTTKLQPEHAASALTQARYPATLQTVGRSSTSAPVTDALNVEEWLRDLLTPAAPHLDVRDRHRDLAAQLQDAHERYNNREIVPTLELAIKQQATVNIWVHTGDDEVCYALQPVALSGRRLRAKDPVAQVERTLQVSAITRVEPVHT